LFHLEVTPEMIQNWIENYEPEMKETGATADTILNDKKNEFKGLANNCKLVYSNFSKMIKA
jgi:GMP synthase (glutamine-hydrolysing)